LALPYLRSPSAALTVATLAAVFRGAMADVFVSYAKTDRPLALKLAAMLEAEGWKTWWDTSLTIGDDFRNEIMTELGRARAVIVIWTDASIKSDWVRSEAGRAQADRKLIPVKLPHLVYEDLPPPFDVLHTENVGEEDKIKAAVVAQLAKPAVEPSPWALLGKGFKYEVLTWVGIVGGALTLFTNLGSVLKLADWARVLVQHWKEWTHAFWVWTFGWLGIHVPPEWSPVLSFLLFGALLTIGQAVQFSRTTKARQTTDEHQGKSFQLISRRFMLSIVSVLPFATLAALGTSTLLGFAISGLPQMRNPGVFTAASAITYTVGLVAGIVPFARHRLYAAVVAFLMGMFWTIIAYYQLADIIDPPTDKELIALTMIMGPILSLLLLSVAPAKDISRRLIFLALGLLLLIALNKLSTLAHYWGVKL
jgi:hypothetical protein